MEYSFNPIIDKRSKVIILGSLPGVRSLKDNEYYANRQNSFWKILFSVFDRPYSSDYRDKTGLLTENCIALWDVIKSAERSGSCDSRIRSAEPNNIPDLLKKYTSISYIIFNGTFAYRSYKKFFKTPCLRFEVLLSTSPACAGRDKEKAEMWEKAIKDALRYGACKSPSL